jgi:hypothetical protein
MSESQESGWSPAPPPLPPSEPPGPPPFPSSEGPPWEKEGGWFDRLLETLRQVLFQPAFFFRTMSQTGGLGPPLLFYLITGAAGAIFTAFYQLMFQNLGRPVYDGIAPGVVFILTIVLMPAILVVAVFLGSGIYHLMLMILGGANRPFETTFRVVAYAGGATALISIVPICGGLIGAVWHLVLAIIGLSETHRISTGKAAAAVLVPVVLCCCAVLFVFFFAGLFAALAAGGRW